MWKAMFLAASLTLAPLGAHAAMPKIDATSAVNQELSSIATARYRNHHYNRGHHYGWNKHHRHRGWNHHRRHHGHW